MKLSRRPRDPAIDEEHIHAFVDGALEIEERERVVDFLAAHPRESARVDAYARQLSALRELAQILELTDTSSFCPHLQRRLALALQR